LEGESSLIAWVFTQVQMAFKGPRLILGCPN